MSHSQFNPKLTNPGKLILSTGLGGTGQTTHLKEVARSIPDCVLIEKDILNEAYLGEHKMQSKYYNDHVKMQTYVAMIQLANSLIALGKTVIIDGGVGGKLLSFFKEYLNTAKFETKVIYFHCKGQTQYQRIANRNADRDADKLEAKFGPYRQDHITKHLEEISQISHLSIDTDDPSQLQQNAKIIAEYIRQPACAPILVTAVPLPKLKIDEAMKGHDEIKILLGVVRSFPGIIKQEVINFFFANTHYLETLNKINNDEDKVQFIWEHIHENVADRVFNDLKGFYSNKDDTDFVDFINTGRNILFSNLNLFLQIPSVTNFQKTLMTDAGSRLHSGKVRLWSFSAPDNTSIQKDEVHAGNVYRP